MRRLNVMLEHQLKDKTNRFGFIREAKKELNIKEKKKENESKKQ